MDLPPPRPYRDERDLARMRAVLSAGRLANNGTHYIHPGDLNWWWFYHDREQIFPKATHIWEEGGEISGWTLNWNGEVDVYPHPRLRATSEAIAMYTWAEERALEILNDEQNEITFSSVSDKDAFLIAHLESRGFTRDEKYLVHHARPLEGLEELRAVEGYTVRGVAGEHEWPSRARASRAAFGVQRDREGYLENFIRFARSPVYDFERDVVAADPDGEIGAFAIFWIDPVSKSGLFEPVGTHPDHQRRGLGRAILLEGLQRMAMRGMRTAEVCAYHDNAAARGLYEAVGFTPVRNLRSYSKPIGDF